MSQCVTADWAAGTVTSYQPKSKQETPLKCPCPSCCPYRASEAEKVFPVHTELGGKNAVKLLVSHLVDVCLSSATAASLERAFFSS